MTKHSTDSPERDNNSDNFVANATYSELTKPVSAFSCEICGSLNSAVIDTRISSVLGKGTVRRRRVCQCDNRYTTYELRSDQIAQLNQFSKQLNRFRLQFQAFVDNVSGIAPDMLPAPDAVKSEASE